MDLQSKLMRVVQLGVVQLAPVSQAAHVPFLCWCSNCSKFVPLQTRCRRRTMRSSRSTAASLWRSPSPLRSTA